MITIKDTDLNSLSNELSDALVKISNGRLSDGIADQIANVTIKNIDFSNSALTHKGINWFAKEILKKIDFSAVEMQERRQITYY